MSKIDNPIMEGMSGKLGRSVVYRTVNGRVIMGKRPKTGRAFSDTQTDVQRKFLRASRYAALQMEQPEAKALYERGITEKKTSAYAVALSDYLNAPVVSKIEATNYLGDIGNTIRIEATDDFRVTEVKVIITDAQGTRLEAGDAQFDLLGYWVYQITHPNPLLKGTTVKAIAFDRPGNTGALEIVL